jgi:sec-independent protein translocase protein TatB
MMFGLTWDKLLLIGLLALIIVGPDRLPSLAASFARIVHKVGIYLRGARDRVKEEMGGEFDDVQWQKLDPRQYDPRRILRDALLDDAEPAATAAPARPTRTPQVFTGEGQLPYDDEAT